LISINISQ